MTKNKQRKIHYIKWIDSGISIHDGWSDINTILKTIEPLKKAIETVGILIKEDEDWIILATTTHNGQINGGFGVYKKNIVERRVLN
jgi:hypothetical protein